MSYLYNKESTKKSRSLRKQQTTVELHLWTKLRDKRLLGFKFYRQYPIGVYIVDFYCPAKKLVIELDGSQHLQRKDYDNERTIYLEKQGIAVLRFWDNDVLNKRETVLEAIYRKLK